MSGPFGNFETTASFSGLVGELNSLDIGETISVNLSDPHSYYSSHTTNSTAIGVHGHSRFDMTGTVSKFGDDQYKVDLEIRPRADWFDYDYNGVSPWLEAARFGAWVQAGLSTFGAAFFGTQFKIEFVGPGKKVEGVYSYAELVELGIKPECFPGFTPIYISSGLVVPIDEIANGDTVLAFATDTTTLTPARVTRLFHNITHEWIELDWLDPATGQQRSLTATPGHVMLTPEGGWKQLIEMIVPPYVPDADIFSAREERGAGGLTKGQEFGTHIGTARLVSAEGHVVVASAYHLKYSADTAHLFEEAEMLVTRTEGGLAAKPEWRLAA